MAASSSPTRAPRTAPSSTGRRLSGSVLLRGGEEVRIGSTVMVAEPDAAARRDESARRDGVRRHGDRRAADAHRRGAGHAAAGRRRAAPRGRGRRLPQRLRPRPPPPPRPRPRRRPSCACRCAPARTPAASSSCRRAAEVSLGRSPESTFMLQDPRISARHAVVRRQDGKVTVQDLGSANGTLRQRRRRRGQRSPRGQVRRRDPARRDDRRAVLRCPRRDRPRPRADGHGLRADATCASRAASRRAT